MSNKVSTKICIYDKNTLKRDVLFGNGDYILDNICISCVPYENIDGTSELDATFIKLRSIQPSGRINRIQS